MSAEKYPSKFSHQMEAIVYLDDLVCSITATWLPQLVEHQSAEREIEGLSPRSTNTQGLEISENMLPL